VEGSANSCTNGYVGGNSGGGSVGAMDSAGGGSSNRIDGCSDSDGCVLIDLMPVMTSILYMSVRGEE
jgi:hypothetical protein